MRRTDETRPQGSTTTQTGSQWCSMVTRPSSLEFAVTGSPGLDFWWGLHLWHQGEVRCSFPSPSGRVDRRRRWVAMASFGQNIASVRGLSDTPLAWPTWQRLSSQPPLASPFMNLACVAAKSWARWLLGFTGFFGLWEEILAKGCSIYRGF
jgi:hypothetical protein